MYPEYVPEVPPVGPNIDLFPLFQYLGDQIVAVIPYILIFIRNVMGVVVGISLPIAVLLLIGIVYTVERLKMIRKKESELYDLKVEPAYEKVDEGDPNLALRWDTVMKHIESPNENDWKQAILEADIILDDILSKMGYRGESVGEKLKRVEPSDFNSLNEAWEAHKVRNNIAHEGSNFSISQHEAKKVINMYKKVFEEFYYI